LEGKANPAKIAGFVRFLHRTGIFQHWRCQP
jgi:hypothetical protein